MAEIKPLEKRPLSDSERGYTAKLVLAVERHDVRGARTRGGLVALDEYPPSEDGWVKATAGQTELFVRLAQDGVVEYRRGDALIISTTEGACAFRLWPLQEESIKKNLPEEIPWDDPRGSDRYDDWIGR